MPHKGLQSHAPLKATGAKNTGITHTVKSGDTLSKIAQNFGVNVGDITGFRSGNPDLIFPGEQLTIGRSQGSAPVRVSGESPADFTSRIDRGGTTGLETGERPVPAGLERPSDQLESPSQAVAPQRPPTPPAVGSSFSERFREIQEEIERNRPQAPDLFGQGDQANLDLARQERTGIDAEIVELLDQKLAITDELRKFGVGQVGLEEAGRVGAISEAERNAQQRLDSINRRELVLEVKLANRNNTINALMQAQRLEFTDAVADYNQRFSQALQLYNIFDAEEEELVRDSKANLDVLAGTLQIQLESGDFEFDQISDVQIAQIEEMELQAGLPLGSTLAVLQTIQPGEEKLYSGVDDEGTFTLITRLPNGEINVQKEFGVVPPKDITPTGVTDEPVSLKQPEFSRVVEAASALVGAERGKASRVAIADALNNEDYASAYAQIANNVEQSLTGTNKTKFANQRTDFVVLTSLRDAIQEFADGGGETGFLKGTADSIARKFGQLKTDPEFASLAVELEREFQAYRQSLTGAAFSPEESRDYEKVNPSSNKSLDLNLATIDGALSGLERRITSTIEVRVPGANEIFALVSPEEQDTGGQSTLEGLGITPEDEGAFDTVISASGTDGGGDGFFSSILEGFKGFFK